MTQGRPIALRPEGAEEPEEVQVESPEEAQAWLEILAERERRKEAYRKARPVRAWWRALGSDGHWRPPLIWKEPES